MLSDWCLYLALVDIRKLLAFESEGVAADFMPATT